MNTVIKLSKWHKNEPPIKIVVIDGRRVCRCGNIVAVGPKTNNEIGKFNLPEGYYNANNIILPDELKFDNEEF